MYICGMVGTCSNNVYEMSVRGDRAGGVVRLPRYFCLAMYERKKDVSPHRTLSRSLGENYSSHYCSVDPPPFQGME